MSNELINDAEPTAFQDLFAQIQVLCTKIQNLNKRYKKIISEKNVIPQQTAINEQQTAINNQQIAALLEKYKQLQPLVPKLKQAENAAFSPAELAQLTDIYTAAKQFVTTFPQLPVPNQERLANVNKQSEQVVGLLEKCKLDTNAGRQGGVQMVGKTAEAQNAPTIELISPASSPIQLKDETSYSLKVKVTSTGTGLSVMYKSANDGKSYQSVALILDKDNILAA